MELYLIKIRSKARKLESRLLGRLSQNALKNPSGISHFQGRYNNLQQIHFILSNITD